MNTPRTKRCRTCRTRKYLRAFYARAVLRGGYEHECKACVHKRKARTGPVRRCTDCGRRVRRFLRCSQCRETRQREAEHVPQTPGPGVCGLPTRSGPCLSALQFGCDRMGRSTMWCIVHHERLMPVTGVRAYDQRVVMEEELGAFIKRARMPARPNPKSQRRMNVQIMVIGRALADKIRVA